jgi:hypothetical protein
MIASKEQCAKSSILLQVRGGSWSMTPARCLFAAATAHGPALTPYLHEPPCSALLLCIVITAGAGCQGNWANGCVGADDR